MAAEQCKRLDQSRACLQKSLSVGVWSSDKVLITQRKGRSIQTTGIPNHEAVFYLESGALELWRDGFPISVQQGFHSMLTHSLSAYLAYSTLKRGGCITHLHNVSPYANSNESNSVLEVTTHSNPLSFLSTQLEAEIPSPGTLRQISGICLFEGNSITCYSLDIIES